MGEADFNGVAAELPRDRSRSLSELACPGCGDGPGDVGDLAHRRRGREGRGAHFDPGLLDLFMGRLDEVLAVRERLVEEAAADRQLWPPEDAA